MIDQTLITKDWLTKVAKENRNADKILVEKVIRALLLLEGLVKQKIKFVFKGGTALMLLLNSTKRLSIDIDIILPESPGNLEDILDAAAKEQGFSRKVLQHRITQTDIKKEHYKYFYTPIHKSKGEEDSVLLDILFEEVKYSNVIHIPIQSSFIPLDTKPLLVDVPCFEDILGDKLTAFSPNTTGIPYFKKEDSMSMEIIKQLYDIGNLFDVISNTEILKSTFYKFAAQELVYRNQVNTKEGDVLEDIFQTSLCIVTRGSDGKGDFNKLLEGIQRVSRFIFSESYHLDKAITSASKAAYLSVLIKFDSKSIEKFKDPMQVKDWSISPPMNTKLNRLKKSNPEAFFYWYKIFKLSNLRE
ncbi:MAG: nucleotidyl transferase AbiEii/AbiGii toxin family protein [Ignavibacteriaceae bacterium]|nr:nucleotidyl transferase AbiEii/AbiGii toxin family protein [Ignavibacteriaceae bacterium]